MAIWAVKFCVDGSVEADTQEEAEEIVSASIDMMMDIKVDGYTIDDPEECFDDELYMRNVIYVSHEFLFGDEDSKAD